MIVSLPCGCTIDDETHSTVHDAGGHHYPISTSPKTFCFACDVFRPCGCAIKALKSR